MAFINLKKLLIFFSLFLSYLSKENSKELSIIFNRDPIIQNVNNSEIMSNLFYNRIFINTKIASPNQNIKFYLRFNEYITYITNNYYKKEDSTSYEFIRTKKDKESPKFTPLDFKTDDLKKGYESKEVLKIEDNLLNNFYFILVDELYKSSEFYEPVIGLNLPGNDIKSVLLNTNILEQLKKNHFINKRIFSVFYFNKINKEINENKGNENGQIIFGKLPHELNDEKKYSQISKYNFNYNDLNWANAEAGDFHMKWKLKFDSINFSNQKMSDLVAELVIEQNPFIGNTQFRQIINTFFFDEFISKNICKVEKFINKRENLGYYFYSCDNSVKSYINKNKNNILQFKSKDLNEIFSFNLEELFLEYSNRLFFGVIFDEYGMHGWKLGRLFFEKYPLIFSVDNKAIGYYKQNQSLFNNKDFSKSLLFFLIVLIIVLLFILFIGLRKYNILKSLIPRKLKANELNDQFTYIHVEDKKEIVTEMVPRSSDNNVSALGY